MFAYFHFICVFSFNSRDIFPTQSVWYSIWNSSVLVVVFLSIRQLSNLKAILHRFTNGCPCLFFFAFLCSVLSWLCWTSLHRHHTWAWDAILHSKRFVFIFSILFVWMCWCQWVKISCLVNGESTTDKKQILFSSSFSICVAIVDYVFVCEIVSVCVRHAFANKQPIFAHELLKNGCE